MNLMSIKSIRYNLLVPMVEVEHMTYDRCIVNDSNTRLYNNPVI